MMMLFFVRPGGVTTLAVAAALGLAACGSVRYPAHYVLDVPTAPAPAAPAPASAAAALGPLAVRDLGCPPYLCDGRVVYREGANRVGFYDYHRWAVAPRATLTRLLADRVRAASVFESVTIAGSPARAAYLLRGQIERFEEVDEEASVRAICTISAEIVDVKTGTVTWIGTASESVALKQRDVAGVVAGLGVASRTVVDRLVASIAGELAPGRSP